MFGTFKASIETQVEAELIEKGEVFNFNPNNPWRAEFIIQNIRHEVFEFSKEDIIFSPKQKEQYKDFLRLNPFSGGVFADGVKYKLERVHEKGNTKYFIEVDELKAELKLNWWNRGLIEWVHGRKVNWNLWQAIIGVVLIIVTIIGIIVQVWAASKSPKDGKDNSATRRIEKTNEPASYEIDNIKKSDSTISLPDTIKH